MNEEPNNILVSANRGAAWKKKLLTGRLSAQMNPTKLRLARVDKSISQRVTSKKLKLSMATYTAIERSRRLVSKERAHIISNFFGKQLGSIFERQESGKYLAI
jgi:DNA-binding XRE family transcriptional regulator